MCIGGQPPSPSYPYEPYYYPYSAPYQPYYQPYQPYPDYPSGDAPESMAEILDMLEEAGML